MSAAVHALDPAMDPQTVLAGLDPAVRRLVRIVATLYGGSWTSCGEDIRRRRAGRPYLYRIDLPGLDALAWLPRLSAYEAERGESLAPLVTDADRLHPAENRP